MKELKVGNLDVSAKVEMVETILDHMHTKARGLGQAGYLLGGDTGVGKTSFVRDLGILLGMEIVIIETPHIVEEHIIDIPFIIVKPSGGERAEHMSVDTKSSQKEYDIEFAQSHLYTTLKAAKPVPDAQLLVAVRRRGDLFKVWQELGGTETKVPTEISKLRKTFHVILFLDEYFRQTSKSIRNMLRSILNGRIGSQELPSNVYTIFASNLVDQGVGDILENEDFKKLDFDAPSVDQWFSYMLHKYEKDPKVKLNMDFMKGLYDLMKSNPDTLSHDDDDADVRVSPRRWEQLAIYVSSSLPVKDEKDASILLKNVDVNFSNYVDNAKAGIGNQVHDLVADIIKKTQKISASSKNVDDSDWRDTLRHQIEARMKAGTARKYIPVIGGMPGAGKTTHIVELATDLNLVPVRIDVQNLSPEEILGTPLADTSAGKIKVSFSKPPLWDTIMKQMDDGEKMLKERLIQFHGKDEGAKLFKQWQQSDNKYLIFFDELNRTDTKVFNAIRKVLLEKEFNPDYVLPEESIMVAAINPTGKGVQELTKHVRDVFDVIPVGISWSKFNSHIDKTDFGVSKEAAGIATSALRAFVDRFRVKGEKRMNADPHFFLNVAGDGVYMSPREMFDMTVGVAQKVERAYQRELDKMGEPDHKIEESEDKIRAALYRAMSHSIGFTLQDKHGIDAKGFMQDLEEWVMTTDQISMGGAFKKTVASVKNLKDILSIPTDSPDKHLFEDPEFVNYITSVDPVIFKEDFSDFLTAAVLADIKNAMEKTHKKKTLTAANKVKIENVVITKLEYLAREILHALKVHDASNKLIEQVEDAVADALSNIAEEADEAITDVIRLSRELNNYITQLRKQKA